MAEQATNQFVLLPAQGLRATGPTDNPDIAGFLSAMPHVDGFSPAASVSVSAAAPAPMQVLDSIHEDGAKLVEMSPATALALRAAQPGLRIVPVVFYEPAVVPPTTARREPTISATVVATQVTFQVVSRTTGNPIPGALVVAFTNFAARTGAQGATGADGKVNLLVGAVNGKLDRVYVFPDTGFWSALRKRPTVSATMRIEIDPVDLSFKDALRTLYTAAPLTLGAGVTVGVVDSGIELAHPDLRVDGGENTVVGEVATDFGDNGGHHGTHVGGIIAARGTPPTGLRGLAPNVTLRSYRVFGKDSRSASNFAIAKAIDRAVADNCDLINMSLGGGDPDVLTQEAIADARAQGVLVIVAAGNDGRQPVSFPAVDPLAIAVSAMGRKGAFPAGSSEAGDVAGPFGADPKNFIARFSNVGPEIDVTGTGVGILSTVPGGYAPMSGTSMACPAVTGIAARVLAANAGLRAMARNEARSDAIAAALFDAARDLGFALELEGHGFPEA